MLIFAGVQSIGLLVPKELQDHFKALEKDLDNLRKDRERLEAELNKDIQGLESSKALPTASQGLLSLTIPIPVWSRKVRLPDYKPSDPEWQEYLKLEEDRSRVKKLKNQIGLDIAEAIIEGLSPAVERSWGFEKSIGVASNIDFVFPWGPPQVYERPELRIAANGITWTSRRLPDENGRRFHRIFHPMVFASAFWAGGTALWKFYNSVAEAKALKFLDAKTRPSTSDKVPIKGQGSRDAKAVQDGRVGFSAAEKSHLRRAFMTPTSVQSSISAISTDSKELLRLLVPSPAPKSAMEAAIKAYKHKHTSLQVAAWQECPRGGCWLMGFVDLVGTRATVRISVKAVYIPSRDVFLGPPILGEAVVMPKVSQVTAENLQIEKLKAERFQEERMKAEKIKIDEAKKDPGQNTPPK